jgi:hypothetical protein
MVDECVFS